MARSEIQNKCFKCGCEGVWIKNTLEGEVEIDPCPICNGSKFLSISSIKLPSGCFNSNEVYGAIDHAEYVALSSPNEEYVNAITSLGIVDLNEGSRARTVLWNLFDSESTTRANLIVLIG